MAEPCLTFPMSNVRASAEDILKNTAAGLRVRKLWFEKLISSRKNMICVRKVDLVCFRVFNG